MGTDSPMNSDVQISNPSSSLLSSPDVNLPKIIKNQTSGWSK